MPSEQSPLFIQSFDKVMRVLEAFRRSEQYLGLSEIVSLTGLDKPQAQRCTHTLAATGYLEKHPQTGRFCLGKKCLDLSFHFLRAHPLVALATPVLLQLRRDCGERTNLSLFDRTTLVYVIRLHGKREYPQFSTLIGRRMATFCSAGGRAMLAALPDDEARQILAESDLTPATADTLTDPDLIMAEIEKTRSRGYGFVVNESAPSEVTVAAAVLDGAGRPVAAVHVAGTLTKWDPADYEKRFSPFVVETARALNSWGPGQLRAAGEGRVTMLHQSAERELAAWLAAREEAMLALLADTVDIDSGTDNLAGIDAVAACIAAFLQAAGLPPTRPRGARCALRAEVPGAGAEKSILLMGHLDTVFPAGEASRRPFRRDGGRGRGPGVADMKAGLVMNGFVLAAFKALGGNRAPPRRAVHQR